MDDYRPISLLASISKLFEKVVFTQLYDYFHKINFSIQANTASENCTLLSSQL